jgi:hypothetical protein
MVILKEEDRKDLNQSIYISCWTSHTKIPLSACILYQAAGFGTNNEMKTFLPTDLHPQYGILALYDILGYQNLIINNKIEIAASVVLNIIENLPEMVRTSLTSKFFGDIKKFSEKILQEIKWNIFSDTIFGSITLDETDSEVLLLRKWALFLASCLLLQRRAFDEGLPLRGALATGMYILKDRIFVGMPIVDAYKLCQGQNWSGVALTGASGKEFERIMENHRNSQTLEGVNEFLSMYPVPMKSGETISLICLRWCGARNLISFTYNRPNDFESLRNLVEQKFREHNKTIASEVADKINNTALFLQYIYEVYYTRHP